MLEVKEVSANLDSFKVLKNISFQVAPGEILGVIGPNGAGKTTLLRSISGLVPIARGQITLDGELLLNKSIEERAKLITVVPQVSLLPPAFTVWDVVMMGRTPYLNWLGQTSQKDDKVVRDSLIRTQTLDLAERKINEISAGEQQRVLLARALAQTTPVLMMDEPTTHLDLRYQIELLSLVQGLMGEDQLTVIIVLHDLNLAARYANNLLLLNEGKVAGYGQTLDVLEEKLLSRVYQLPIRINIDSQSEIPRIFPS